MTTKPHSRPARLDGAHYSVIDTETTGLGFEARIIEIGVYQMDANFNHIYTYETLVNPHGHISSFITELTGINNALLNERKAPTWPKVWPYLAYLLDNTILVGHNIEFDIRMLAQTVADERSWPEVLFAPGHPLCTYRLSGDLHMDACLDKFNLVRREHRGRHTAAYDAECSAALLRIAAFELEPRSPLFDKARPCAATIPSVRR